jgi:hypothetical protein
VSLALVIRFFRLGLSRGYRFFLAYLVFESVRGIVTWFSTTGASFYQNFWRMTEPGLWVLYVLVVLELCSFVFKDYRGIQALGRWTVYGSLIVSVCLSTVALLPTWERYPAFSLQRYLMVERGIDFAMVLLLLLLLAFLVLFPIQLTRNAIIHCVLYSVFFLSNSIGILIVNLTGYRLNVAVSTSLMGVAVSCLIAWLTLMNREGEREIIAIHTHIPLADEDALIAQLSEINATLLRASRKSTPAAFSAHR